MQNPVTPDKVRDLIDRAAATADRPRPVPAVAWSLDALTAVTDADARRILATLN